MSLQRGMGDAEPVGRLAGSDEIRIRRRSTLVAVGSLACPGCDAPVLPDRPLSPADDLSCGFCRHAGAVRDFLTLGAPTRPAHVTVRVV